MNNDLLKYIDENVFPKYERYYSHGMVHIKSVIDNCLLLADYYKLDKNMAYTIGAYHDLGLNVDRDNHEYESGKLLYEDEDLKKYFNDEQIKIMKEAVEDHRGSKKDRPRNIYGEIVSDADRDFDITVLAKRQIYTSIKNYPELKTFDEHFERCYNYILDNAGHMNLWTNCPLLLEKKEQFIKKYMDKDYTRSIYKKEWDWISSGSTMEKILNYYLDY